MNILIQLFVSSTCFERHVLIIRKTICTLILKSVHFDGLYYITLS